MVNAKAFQESQSCGWVVASRGLQLMSKFCTLRPVLSEMTPHNIEVQHCARGNNDACQITKGKITNITWSPQMTSCTQPSSKNAHSVLKFYTTCVKQGLFGRYYVKEHLMKSCAKCCCSSKIPCTHFKHTAVQKGSYKPRVRILTRSPACHPIACPLLPVAPYFSTINTNCNHQFYNTSSTWRIFSSSQHVASPRNNKQQHQQQQKHSWT